MKTKSQKARCIYKLKNDGLITRNECLRQIPAITRLGAIVEILENEGWVFKAGYTEDKSDYKYEVIKSPFQRVIYKTEFGQEIISYQKK
jgi:hypothetical protein